jgi:hypothetical protein
MRKIRYSTFAERPGGDDVPETHINNSSSSRRRFECRGWKIHSDRSTAMRFHVRPNSIYQRACLPVRVFILIR